MSYELHYWPTIQGRGEFARLALEASGASYVDVPRGDEVAGLGVPAMMHFLRDPSVLRPPFAPPFLKDGELLIGQTAAILQHLGPPLRLVARSEQARIWTHQIQLTLCDFVGEAHDTHHPISTGLYYEEQQPEASHRAQDFCSTRMPKFMRWFESLLQRNPGGSRHLVGGKLSYTDLSLFQMVEGLQYAFPKAARALTDTPLVQQLHARVAALPALRAYLASERRIPFNQQGLFRRYPELDLP